MQPESPPPVPILSQMNPIHTFPPVFLGQILILSSHVRLGLARDIFPVKIVYALRIYTMRVTSPIYPFSLILPPQ